ncbi:prostate-associated microseminoprotein-like [Dunckerocampus dactyliophorus]|uniref:prostate-associated microseminoprotein-like n=1 Tax=Dunckerocampus dactyliophorus TaxID=161453 RepID=UPI002404E131|nr:prostate-associated microseminoprotein-like [Dunckerocampus dactyliophorus]XP_054639239.1 prostate-associated microseminoprotein-like [Dunckerocampus dactyliophorus]
MAKATAGVFLACVVVLLGGSSPSSSLYNSGECFFNTKGSCEYMGQVYGIGESWTTTDCYQCVCMEPFGVGCCDHGSKPVDYPEWCEIILKPGSCTSVVVMRANHKLPCLWGRGRLRPAAGLSWKSDNEPLF